MRYVLVLAGALALALGAACGGGVDDAPDDGLPTITIAITGEDGSREELTAELARTAAERGRGLMFRETLAEDGGMLFVFPEETETAFWMKDTLVPLSIAFIAGDGEILDIQDMEPLSTDPHGPRRPYRYALEVNQGWFSRHGLGTGAVVEIPDSVVAAEAEDGGE